MEILQACCRRGRFVFVFDNTWSFTISSHFRVMVECLCCFYSALSHDRRVFNKFKIRWFWLALLVSVYLNLLHRAMFGSNQHRSRYPFSYRFPKDITSVFSLVFSIIMCILSLWVSSLFEGNRELSCVSGTREEARDPRISSPLACSLACYRVPRLTLLATRNGELVLRILYSWHFSQYISNDIHEENVSLVDDYCFS